MNQDAVLRLFRAIDAKNADAFASFLAPDGVFRFANAPAVVGQSAVRESVAGFFSAIAGSAHTLLHIWNDGDDVAVQGSVRYTRHDGKQLACPFVNVFKMKGDKIGDYAIHIDNTALFAP
ncbi:MAG TPA: nuclear transport factor 2 family protein [Polyangiaceae bacterium]